MKPWPTALALLLLGFGAASAAAETIPAGQLDFFENRIRPVLVEKCYKCHAEDSEKLKGGLLLDSRDGMLTGGDSGPALVAGKPEESLLFAAIKYEDPDTEMPPKEKLPDAVIADFEKWIAMGAPDPRVASTEVSTSQRSIDIEKERRFWSFQPIADPPAPEIEDTAWPRDSADHFILATLEKNGLDPAPDTSREALLRRVTIDLSGLPPTVEEQDAFLSDHSPNAFEKVVDRLLASGAFGERWGRHWLDIARYSDSSGGGRALPFPDAWRFRDYVIRSFREDRPLDQLIREHIAGDLMAHSDEDASVDQLVATGFLVMGPINYETQDKELLELDIVDEQIDTIGRAFLGMTIGCARCHDHKFDPVPTRDYYAMAGIFMSTEFVEHANVSMWTTAPLPPNPQQAAALKKHEEETAVLQSELSKLKNKLAAMGRGTGGDEKSVAVASLSGIVVDNADAELEGAWENSEHSPRFVGAGYIHDFNQGKGAKSVTFRPVLPEMLKYEVAVSYSTGPSRSTRANVLIHSRDGDMEVRLNQKVAPERDRLFQSLGTFYFSKGTEGFVRISNEGADDGFVIADAVQFLPVGQDAPKAGPEDPVSEEVIALEKELDALQSQLKKHKLTAPKLPVAMSVKDKAETADTPIRIRGVARNFGETARRGFLRVAVPPGADPAPPLEGSGRLELAAWIASPDNPLTARVLANRIWLHLFGEGIVRSPDNFGTTGELPTHPELLDHLARRLIEGGWRTKALVRDLVLSRAYRMSSAADGRGNAIDPENRLLWRMNRRRLDAETLRDSVLLLAGNLDREGGGPSLPADFKSEFGFEFTTRKRSVYVPVFRNELYEVFSAFGFANPNFVVGQRSQSTIPTQSLFLMNSPFIHENAADAAKILLERNAASDRERIRFAYRRALGREPAPAEEELSLAFIRPDSPEKPASAEAWAGLTRALFTCVDFQYIP